MTSSFYIFAKFVVTLGSFVALVRQLREGNVFLKLMRSRVDFWGGCGVRDEGRSFFCFWYLTFVSVLFFLVFRKDGKQKN